eukprot:Skav206548  [mRNA]  locus=scaffold504:378074:381434:+ [translate_table: standard]
MTIATALATALDQHLKPLGPDHCSRNPGEGQPHGHPEDGEEVADARISWLHPELKASGRFVFVAAMGFDAFLREAQQVFPKVQLKRRGMPCRPKLAILRRPVARKVVKAPEEALERHGEERRSGDEAEDVEDAEDVQDAEDEGEATEAATQEVPKISLGFPTS